MVPPTPFEGAEALAGFWVGWFPRFVRGLLCSSMSLDPVLRRFSNKKQCAQKPFGDILLILNVNIVKQCADGLCAGYHRLEVLSLQDSCAL